MVHQLADDRWLFLVSSPNFDENYVLKRELSVQSTAQMFFACQCYAYKFICENYEPGHTGGDLGECLRFFVHVSSSHHNDSNQRATVDLC